MTIKEMKALLEEVTRETELLEQKLVSNRKHPMAWLGFQEHQEQMVLKAQQEKKRILEQAVIDANLKEKAE